MTTIKPTIEARSNAAGELVMMIDGPIGRDWMGNGIAAQDVARVLSDNAQAKAITVRINSPGGLVDDGIAIYNMLKDHPARVSVEIIGAAYSAASFVAMAGDEIRMAENAMMMIHDPWGGVLGDSAAMRAEADVLDKLKKNIVATYSARTGKAEEEIAEAMTDESWYTAQEALDAGFITAVMPNKGQGNAKNWAGFARTNYKRPPAAIIEQEPETMADDQNKPIEPAPIDPRAEAKRFVNAFGPQGGQWFAEGLSFDDAQSKHNAAIKADADKVKADNDALAAEVAELKKRLDAATAEPAPVSGGEGAKPKADDKSKPRGLAAAMARVIRLK